MVHPDIIARYRQYLSRQKMLFTRERSQILESVFARADHFSADDLLLTMKNEGLDVSRATLYRNLKQLAKAGVLVEADFGHGHIHYERAVGSSPHEHLICQICGSVTEVSTSAFSAVVKKVAMSQGFRLDHHQVKIFGVCHQCIVAGKSI